MEKTKVIMHYDKLIDENNDPVYDPKPLKDYMDKWDGNEFFELLDLKSCFDILEIGVGTGRLAVRTAPVCRCFYGIDISPKTAEKAKENLSFCNNVNVICGDFEEYEFDRAFDVIYSSLTFMHIENKAEAIKKVFGLLKEKGRFVLSIDKNQMNYIDTGTRSVDVFPDSPDKIEKYLKNAGFSVENRVEKEFAYIFSAEKEGMD